MPEPFKQKILGSPEIPLQQGFSGLTIVARVSKGVGALSLGTVVRALGQMIIVPVGLYSWGKLQYGEWVVLTGLVSILSVAEFGLQTFVGNRLCTNHVRNDRDGMHRVLHSALCVQGPLLAVLLACLGLVVFFLPLEQILKLRTLSGLELFFVVMLLAIEVFIALPIGVIAALYRATGYLARGAVIWAVQQLIIIGATVGLIAGHASVLQVAGVRAGLSLLVSGWILHDLRRSYPWLQIWPSYGSWREGVGMIGPGLFFLFVTMADYLSSQVTFVVVQMILGGGEVSRLSTHRMVATGIQVVGVLLMYAAWPELSALNARSEHERLRQFHRSLAKLNIWLIGGITFVLLPFIPWIYTTWTAGRLLIDVWTMAFLIIRTLLWAMWYPSLTLLLATDRHQYVAPVLLGSAVLTAILAIPLVSVMGMSGAASATLLGDLCLTAWMVPAVAARWTGDHTGSLLKVTSKALALGIALPVAVGFTLWQVVPASSFRYLVIISICGGLSLLFVWRQLGLQERQLAWDVYQQMFPVGR